MIHYNCDEHAQEYKRIARPEEHPAIHKPFVDWEWYFSRPGVEIARWLRDVFQEELPLIVADLLGMGDGRRIVCEGSLPAAGVAALAAPGQAVFLYATPALVREQYFARADKQDMLRLIERLSNPPRYKQNVLDCAVLAVDDVTTAQSLGIKALVRDEHTVLEDRVAEIERHFGLS